MVEIDRPADQVCKRQLNVAMRLVDHHGAMLSYVAALTNIAVVEIRENRFPLDKNAGVIKLPVPSLLSASDLRFCPVTATLVRIASEVGGLRKRERGGVRRLGRDIVDIGARFGVLNVVANECDGPLFPRCCDVEASERVK